MGKSPEKSYINTTVNTDLLRSMKILAAEKGTRLNQLLEEAIQDLLDKYGISEVYLQPNPTKGKNRKTKK